MVAAEKRAGVAARARALPFDALAERASTRGVRDFHAAIAPRGSVIAEVKARTPTVPSFRHGGGLVALAETYARSGAAAISVVADPARFGTSLDDVTRVRAAVALPVVAKDFVVDGYQVLEARTAGADAVLLIARLLTTPELRSLHDLAHDLGMHAVVETHDETDLAAALAAGARILGINNRDLDTMRVSLDTTRRLARLVPDDVLLVSESGIRSRADIDDLSAHGARAFLVGGALLDADDPGARLRELAGPLRGGREGPP
jgi:indole-3-glycerol phosphate synthase